MNVNDLENDLEIFFEFLVFTQNNFSKEMCCKVFLEDSEHFWDKWKLSNCNLLVFISFLDSTNKDKFYKFLVKECILAKCVKNYITDNI